MGEELNFYHEEKFTWHFVVFRVNGTLQHLKFALGTYLDVVLNIERPIFVLWVFNTVLDVVEVGDLAFLDEVVFLLQLSEVLLKPVNQTRSYVDVELLVGRSVQE